MGTVVSETFIRTWFALQRQLIAGLQVAYVDLHGDAVRQGELVVTYPETLETRAELALAAQLALRSGAPVTGCGATTGSGAETLRIACPLHLGKTTKGAVVVEVDAPMAQQAAVLQMLKWGEAWLNLALSQQESEPAAVGYGALLEAAAAQHNYHETRTAVLALLPMMVGCERVALGRSSGDAIKLEAVSAVIDLDRRGSHAKALEAAMQQAFEAGEACAWPDARDDQTRPSMQAELAQTASLAAVLSVPLTQGLREPRVFCFEFGGDALPGAQSRTACTEAAGLAAILLALRHEQDRPWRQRFAALCREGLQGLWSRHGRLRRLLLAASLGLLLLVALSPGDYRVSAPAVLEGAVQRAVVAPFDGFVTDAVLRAGQEVSQGDLLARLDDRDLKRERQRLLAEQEELSDQHGQALATLDHGEARIVEAQLDQLSAELDLTQAQLRRTVLRAPFDGVIISGDWSRAEGVPVSRGELMFEVAPLASYRVAIQLADRDIADLSIGQQGELILAALPRQPVRLAVTNIATLADEAPGEPGFRVEAELLNPSQVLRPGMEGVAKIGVGQRQRWWIWTHALTDWLRLQLWRWLP